MLCDGVQRRRKQRGEGGENDVAHGTAGRSYRYSPRGRVQLPAENYRRRARWWCARARRIFPSRSAEWRGSARCGRFAVGASPRQESTRHRRRPIAVAEAFRAHFGLSELYLADLDAIAGRARAAADVSAALRRARLSSLGRCRHPRPGTGRSIGSRSGKPCRRPGNGRPCRAVDVLQSHASRTVFAPTSAIGPRREATERPGGGRTGGEIAGARWRWPRRTPCSALWPASNFFSDFPDYQEGDMTKVKSVVVSRAHLRPVEPGP